MTDTAKRIMDAASTSDVLTIGGVNWPVQEVIPMDSGGFVISWMVKVAK